MGLRNRMGFFLHIPWPPPDVLFALPPHETIVRALSSYDLVGFQTDFDAENFAACLIREGMGSRVGSQVFDAYGRLKEQAEKNEAPKPADNFRWRYYGLFYVAPAQTSYMCRLKIPNGILKHWQFAGLADLAEQYGGGYAHVTTRANIQLREIEGLSYEEIAAIMNCPIGTVRSRIFRAREAIAAKLRPLLDTRKDKRW